MRKLHCQLSTVNCQPLLWDNLFPGVPLNLRFKQISPGEDDHTSH